MSDFQSWCLFIGISLYGFVVSTTISLLAANFCRHYQVGRARFLQVAIGTVGFTLGTVISFPITIGTIILALGGGGYGILTFELWLILTGLLQILVNFGVVCWSVYQKKVDISDWRVVAFMLGCAIATFFYVMKDTLLWKGSSS